ncbi:reverse transcriptase family protein, partial [Chryseobacterium sp.]|uniref:RNA-directed DNA polymerase n=1 Tax=Chryseobacterium sp. TaxID=1871047 RepID=UPI00321B0B61
MKTTTGNKITQHNPQQTDTFTNRNNNRANFSPRSEIKSSCIDHTITCTPHNVNCNVEVIENTSVVGGLDTQHRPIITSLFTHLSLSHQLITNNINAQKPHNTSNTHFSQNVPIRQADLQELRDNNNKIIEAYSSWRTRRMLLRYGSQWENPTQQLMWCNFMKDIEKSSHCDGTVDKITTHLYQCLHHTSQHIMTTIASDSNGANSTTTANRNAHEHKRPMPRGNARKGHRHNNITRRHVPHFLHTSLHYLDMIRRIRKKQSTLAMSGSTLEGVGRANTHRVIHCVLDVLQKELNNISTQHTITEYEKLFQESTRLFENGAPAEAERLIKSLSSTCHTRPPQQATPKLLTQPQNNNTQSEQVFTTTDQQAADHFMAHIKPLLTKKSSEQTLLIINTIREKSASLNELYQQHNALHTKSINDYKNNIINRITPPDNGAPRGDNLLSINNCLESTINTWLFKMWHDNNRNHKPHPISNVVSTALISAQWHIPPKGPGTQGIDWLCDEGTPAYKAWGKELRRCNNELKELHTARRRDSTKITTAECELKLLQAQCPWIPSKCFSNTRTNCNSLNKTITRDEVAAAIRAAQNFKSQGSDFITAEPLKVALLSNRFDDNTIIDDTTTLEGGNNTPPTTPEPPPDHSMAEDHQKKKYLSTLGHIVQKTRFSIHKDRVKKNKNNKIVTKRAAATTKQNVILDAITATLNLIYDSSTIPNMWHLNHITMLYKGGNKSDPNNYRPINISATLQKIMNKVLANRLQHEIQQSNAEYNAETGGITSRLAFNRTRIVHNEQCAYLEGRGCFEQIATLLEYNDYNANKRKKHVYNLFIDMTKAFDNVDHAKMLQVLSVKLNLPTNSKFLKYIDNAYNNIFCTVRSGSHFSEVTQQECGIKQGCSLSPILFVIYIDTLLDMLEEELDSTTLHELLILCFADDLEFSCTDEGLLKKLIEAVERHLHHLGLKMNDKKSNVMIVKPTTATQALPSHQQEVTSYAFTSQDGSAKTIFTTDSYKYLGIVIDQNLNMNVQQNNILGPAFAYKPLYHPYTPQHLKIKIFTTYVYPKIVRNTAILGLYMMWRSTGGAKQLLDTTRNHITNILMDNHSHHIETQSASRTTILQAWGIPDYEEQITTEAMSAIVKLTLRDPKDLNPWLASHLYTQRSSQAKLLDARTPIIGAIRKMYLTLQNFEIHSTVATPCENDQPLITRAQKTYDLTKCMPSHMQEIVNRWNSFKKPTETRKAIPFSMLEQSTIVLTKDGRFPGLPIVEQYVTKHKSIG